ncbi:MAG: SoxXA-binding protein [Pseudomonadota bacterium]|nr:SoxXA-binding protein [Pseudomonadota bacterium]
MNMTKTLAALTVGAWLMAGCAGMGGESAEQAQQRYEQAMAAAQSAYDKVYAVEFAWRDSADLMKAAQKAAEKGEYDKAAKLANQSRQESELAYNQYLEQKGAGPRF